MPVTTSPGEVPGQRVRLSLDGQLTFADKAVVQTVVRGDMSQRAADLVLSQRRRQVSGEGGADYSVPQFGTTPSKPQQSEEALPERLVRTPPTLSPIVLPFDGPAPEAQMPGIATATAPQGGANSGPFFNH